MKEITIPANISVKEALKKIDLCAIKVVFVIDDNDLLLGSLTDGDTRRFILSGGNIESSIDGVFNEKPFSLTENNFSNEELKQAFTQRKIEVIPIVDKNGIYKSYYTWDSVLGKSDAFINFDSSALNNIPVVIMAGGKGTRMKPFTDILPKPLIPIKEKPIMDWIIEQFFKYGAQQFYATLNYKGKMIEAYYASIDKKYKIGFKWEDDFFGTAGSLKLLINDISGTFIVSNCDIIVKANYEDIIKFHNESKAMMTVVSSIQHHQLPYGVLEFGENGVITNILEKPEYTHAINTGVYILEKQCLDLIPDNKFFHITHLMEALIAEGKKVITYPVNENDYIDFGQWEEYTSAVENFTL